MTKKLQMTLDYLCKVRCMRDTDMNTDVMWNDYMTHYLDRIDEALFRMAVHEVNSIYREEV